MPALATIDLGEVRNFLRRTEWRAFPDVHIVTNDIKAVKSHPFYTASKEGDPRAAEGLIEDFLDEVQLIRFQDVLKGCTRLRVRE
jgi:hypothetical protein